MTIPVTPIRFTTILRNATVPIEINFARRSEYQADSFNLDTLKEQSSIVYLNAFEKLASLKLIHQQKSRIK
jgi:hypothetical protein